MDPYELHYDAYKEKLAPRICLDWITDENAADTLFRKPKTKL